VDRYTHGHHESVLRTHAWRTAENSAAYLLDSLQPGLDLLDVGCGPGTITMDLAERVAPGRVVGIDSQSEVIARADELRQRRDRANVKFSVGDVYALRFDDARFDVVHAHQLLQHLTRPVEALKEMYRVMRPGGILGVRDSDYAAFAWAPRDPRLERWMHLYHQLTRRNGAEAERRPPPPRMGSDSRLHGCRGEQLDVDLRGPRGQGLVGRVVGRSSAVVIVC